MQRSDLALGMRRRIEADDRQLLHVQRFELQPRLRSPRLVNRIVALRDEPFPPFARRRRKRVRRRSFDDLRQLDRRRRTCHELFEQRATLEIRQPAHVFAIHPQHIEQDVPFAHVSLLQQLEFRHAFDVQRDDLAVNDDLVGLPFLQRFDDVRKAFAEVELVAGPECHGTAGLRAHAAEAVVLQLVRPARLTAGRRVGERRQHRRKELAEQRLRSHSADESASVVH